MREKGGTMSKQSNRSLPVEQWPESLEILRYLAARSEPISIRDVARDVSAPEISTRNRLARLEAQGAVRACRATSTIAPGKQVICTHYAITQHGKDCAALEARPKSPFAGISANSVFAWAAAIGSNYQPCEA